MDPDSILVKPLYNWKSSPEIGKPISLKKRENSQLEYDLSSHHRHLEVNDFSKIHKLFTTCFRRSLRVSPQHLREEASKILLSIIQKIIALGLIRIKKSEILGIFCKLVFPLPLNEEFWGLGIAVIHLFLPILL